MYNARDLGTKTMKSGNVQKSSQQPVTLDTATTGVSVSTRQVEAELPVFEISATVGKHTETQRHTLGVGGTNPKQPELMSTDELQAWLDDKRQIVADNAAWHAAMDASSQHIT